MEHTLTDSSYELVENRERKMRWLVPLIIGCLVLAPLGLGADLVILMTVSNQKEGLSGINLAVMVMVALVSVVLLATGVNRYILLQRWKRQMNQLEMLEETIYSEVLKPRKGLT